MRVTLSLVVVALVPATACAQSSGRPTAERLVEPGCYEPVLGAWEPMDSTHRVDEPRPGPPDEEGDSVLKALPGRFRIEPAADPGPSTIQGEVSVPPNTLDVPHAYRSWRLAGDTLEIMFSTGFSGTRSRLHRSDAGWSGWTEERSDAIGSLLYRRPIELNPVDCSSPSPVPAELDPALLRRIELLDGRFLTLHEPLPPGLTSFPRRSGAWTVEAFPVGVFAGADTIVIRRDSVGTVFHVELRYPEGFNTDPIVDSLDAAHGRSRNRGIPWWQNRTTSLLVFPNERVVLRDRRHF